MDSVTSRLEINIQNNEFIEIRRTFNDHTYEVYTLKSLPGTSETITSLEAVKNYLTHPDQAGLVDELSSGRMHSAEFDFNETHQVEQVQVKKSDEITNFARASRTDGISTPKGMQSSAQKAQDTFQLWQGGEWSDTEWIAPPSAAAPNTAVASPPTSENKERLLDLPPPPTTPLPTTLIITQVATPAQRPSLATGPSDPVAERLLNRLGEEFFDTKRVSLLETSQRLLTDMPVGTDSSNSTQGVQETPNQAVAGLDDPLSPFTAVAGVVDTVAQETITEKPTPRFSETEVDAKVGDMRTILEEFTKETPLPDSGLHVVGQILTEYKHQLNDPHSPVHDAKSFLTFLNSAKTNLLIDSNDRLSETNTQNINITLSILTEARCDKIDGLFFKRFTGAAKVVYVHDDFVYMTHKQANKQEELSEEYAMTVTIRTKSMQSKLNSSIENDETLTPKQKASALRDAKELCEKYEAALNASENTGVYNASTFFKWIDKQSDKDPLQAGINRLETVVEDVDNSLKYIDVERVKVNINGTIFYKAPKGEKDLKNFLTSNDAKNLTPEQFQELVQSMDEMVNTMESVGLLHGDIKPDNILIYTSIEKNAEGKDVVHYHMKIADFGKSGFNGVKPQLHTGNPRFNAGNFDTLENQKESMFYIKMMLITSTYAWDPAAQQRKADVLKITPPPTAPAPAPAPAAASTAPVTEEMRVSRASVGMRRLSSAISRFSRTFSKTPIPPSSASSESQAPKKTKAKTKTSQPAVKKTNSKMADLFASPLGAYLYDQGQSKDNYFTHAKSRVKSFLTMGISTKRNTQNQIETFLMKNYQENYLQDGLHFAPPIPPEQLDKAHVVSAQRDLEALRSFKNFYKSQDPKLDQAITHLESVVNRPAIPD